MSDSTENEKHDPVDPKALIDDSAFEALEKEFQETLQELLGDSALDKFRTEYEKLHKALQKSHDSEKRLMHKCRELNADIVANATKVQTALKLSKEDQTTISSLKKEIEKAWKMVDAAHQKETKARETIQALKLEISNLSKLVEQGAGLSMGTEHSVNQLLKIKDELTKERDDLLGEVTTLRSQLTETTDRQQKIDEDLTAAQMKITELSQDVQVRNNEIQRESRKKEKLERELQQAHIDCDQKVNDIKQMQQGLARGKEDIARLEMHLKEQRLLFEKTVKDQDILQARFQKLQADYESQLITTDSMASENTQKQSELKVREDEVAALRQDAARLAKMRENMQRKLRIVDDQKVDVEGQRETLRNQIAAIERELDLSKKQAEMDRKAIEELVRERDNLNKNMVKAAAATQKQESLVRLHEQAKKNLGQEIQNYKDEASKQQKTVYQLEKDRDRYINEASELTQKVLQSMEDVKVREMQIFDYKKKIAESETKLKQQQNLYEAVRSDRNLYSKNLIEAQDEITEMRRKLKIMTHQIDQLKEEITGKETALVKEHMEFQRVEKDKEALKAELTRMKQQAAETKSYIDTQDAEQRKLLKIIQEADAERLRQKKELDQVISERDILGTQLVRRNDELALLYEKIKIQQSNLNKGEIQYRDRLEDIRVMKLEVKKLRRERTILSKSVANIEDLKKEVHYTQRELLRERTRCKALEEELENPMNIHRWRKLEGSDPSTFEMIQKMQTLQRRLIQKTEEVVEKELMIQEKEKQYAEMKQILARQPSNHASEQLQVYQQKLKEKTKEMKSLASELNMCESQVNEYKFEMDRLALELRKIKKKYYAQKRKEQQQDEKERSEAKASLPCVPPEGPRFTGGGFNLKPLNKTTVVQSVV